MKIDPRHLEILAAIVDGGGLTEGASALGKSQPSVSRSLTMLEQRLGVKLFEPNRRPLQPTEFCLSLAAEGRRILEAGQTAGQLANRFRSGQTGAVRIAGTPVFMDGVVSPRIAAFQSGHPDVRIDQSYGYVPEVIEGLTKGTVDLGILPIRPEEIPDHLVFTEILKGRNVIACRVGHPLNGRGSVKVADIAEFPWIAPPANSPLYHDLRAVLAGIGVQNFKIAFTGGSLSTVINLLTGSDALTVLPYSVVFTLRRQNALDTLSIRIGDPDRHLGILSNPELGPRPVISRFARFIETEFKSLANLILRREQNELWRP